MTCGDMSMETTENLGSVWSDSEHQPASGPYKSNLRDGYSSGLKMFQPVIVIVIANIGITPGQFCITYSWLAWSFNLARLLRLRLEHRTSLYSVSQHMGAQ